MRTNKQELSNVNFDVKKEGGQNKTWVLFVTILVSPNAFYNFPIAVSAMEVVPLISLVAIANICWLVPLQRVLVLSSCMWEKEKAVHRGDQKRLRLCLTAFGFTSVAACASYAMGSPNGVIAHFVPVIKTWQDKYLVDIKQDTEIIKKQNDETNAKLDKVNAMLAQLLVNRPELEKPLVDQIKDSRPCLNTNRTPCCCSLQGWGEGGCSLQRLDQGSQHLC